MTDIVSTAVFRATADTGAARREWSQFGGSVKTIGATVAASLAAAGAAALGVGLAFRKFAGEAQAQEVIFTRLRTAVNSTGTAYADVADDLSAFFAERQRFTTFGDDATADLTASIISLTAATGATIDEVKELTTLAQDMSVALGVDASTAAEALSRAYAGNTQAIGRMLPAHKEALEEIGKIPDTTERARRTVDMLSAQFSGASMNIDAYTLATSRLSNGLGDLRESLGEMVTRNVQIQESISAAADALDSFVETLASGPGYAESFASVVGSAFISVSRLAITAASGTLQVADALIGTTRAAAELLRLTGSSDPALARQQENLNRLSGLIDTALSQEATIQQRARARLDAAELARTADLGQLQTGRAFESGISDPMRRSELQRLRAEAFQLEQQIGMGRGNELEETTRLSSLTQAARAELDALDRRLAASQGAPSRGDAADGGASPAAIAERASARRAESAEAQKVTDAVAGLAIEEEKARASYLARKAEIDAGLRTIADGATAAATAFSQAASTIFQDFVTGGAAHAEAIARKTSEHNIALVEEHMNMVRMLSQQTFDTINGGMLDLVSTTTDGFAAMVIAGESAGAALGGPLLKSLGNVAKQMGTVFLTASGGLTALFSLSPAGLAAAGGALLLIGSTLGALGGVVSGRGQTGGGRGPVGDSGLRAATSAASGPTTQTIVDARGAVFVSDDPATTRNMIRRLDEGRERGGVGRL